MRKFKLINEKSYKGRGRPRKIDYDYFDTYREMIASLIGEPINFDLPIPVRNEVFSEIIKN